jgi:hypothetical protein
LAYPIPVLLWLTCSVKTRNLTAHFSAFLGSKNDSFHKEMCTADTTVFFFFLEHMDQMPGAKAANLQPHGKG